MRSRAAATGPATVKERRRKGAGRSAFVTGSGLPACDGGVKSSRAGPSPIQDAAQSSGPSSTSNDAGPLHANAVSAASQARTRHSYRPPGVSRGPAYGTSADSPDSVCPLSQDGGTSGSQLPPFGVT